MKKVFLITLIIVLFLSGQALADLEKNKWEEAPPLTPWTVLFSAHTSNSGIYGEIIIAQKQEDRPAKIFGTTTYCDRKFGKNRDYFFEAIYIGDQKPVEFIEIISRGKEKYPSVIQEKELRLILKEIKSNDKNWIVLNEQEVKTSPF